MNRLKADRVILEMLISRYSKSSTIREANLLTSNGQARLYRVHLDDVGECVVAKLFSENRAEVLDAVNDEFMQLGLMYEVFKDLAIYGWQVTSPKPLLKSTDPPALLMTQVLGETMDVLMRTSQPRLMNEVVRPISESLAAYWRSSGLVIGDVTARNILLDVDRKLIAFVDPGKPRSAFACDGIPDEYFPASRDLGYLLFSASAMRWTRMFDRKRNHAGTTFVRNLIERHGHDQLEGRDLPKFFDEVLACADRHTSRISTRGPKKTWRLYVRGQTSRRVRATLRNV